MLSDVSIDLFYKVDFFVRNVALLRKSIPAGLSYLKTVIVRLSSIFFPSKSRALST